ncbi:adenine-specific methyltransferase EcoRI family protein [Pectobacterium carotovorum]|uniref:adenine-specific methyltransferase EcoRI family protein n=1 Tax=Pectobacterium carotovorum TaxID=554 RepID=UPI000504AEC0|nr:adenine-specific methyltransferase EcoRI family protein [Pectobacterium carotovorum]KFX00115.1 modification methylase [Pectobacterium carotovorum subsp. carotovorum]KML71512.1 modification methylase [Pectobacterium carotovorum subsp. carotovorum ICMP 5702]
MTTNKTLSKAKKAKKDEFYTQIVDIEREMQHYRDHFKGKVVYCNCDDPYISAFFEYFTKNFEFLGLKKLVTTCYKSQRIDLFSQNDSGEAIKLEYAGGAPNSLPRPDDIGVTQLKGDGDFRSQECIDILKEADIVVTNPPFSLFREYVAQLASFEKKFIIIGNQNAITYKDVFPLIKENKIWLGYGFKRNMAHFIAPHYEDTASDYDHREGMIRVSGVVWYTNLDHNKRHEEMILVQRYYGNEIAYPFYDNYNAIEVSRTQDIPFDYTGAMGVPITFLTKYNPDQFEIIGATESEGVGFSCGLWHSDSRIAQAAINGQKVYKRLFIRNRNAVNMES